MAFVSAVAVVAALARRPRSPAAQPRLNGNRRRPASRAPLPLLAPLPPPPPSPPPHKSEPPPAAPVAPSAPVAPAIPSRRRKPHGYWNDLSNVERELEQVVAQLCYAPRTMPRIAVLQRLGRGDLLAALAKHGGLRRVAALLRWSGRASSALPSRVAVRSAVGARRTANRWRDDGALAREFRRVAAASGCGARMPTRRVLLQLRRSDLVNAAAKRGGLGAFARRAGLQTRAPARGSRYWHEFANVAQHLRAFAEQRCDGRMPTAAELCQAGMSSLSNAVALHGGFHAVATRVGLAKRSSGRGAPTRWTEQRLVGEIELFVRTCMPRLAKEGVLPKEAQLRRFGRNDLSYAIAKFGGFERVAECCGLSKRVSGPFRREGGKVVNESGRRRAGQRSAKRKEA